MASIAFAITSVSSFGDTLTVTGTVNGTPVTVVTNVSIAGTALASATAFQDFIAPLMEAAVPPVTTPYPSLIGIFSAPSVGQVGQSAI
jgi:hypothetical protein